MAWGKILRPEDVAEDENFGRGWPTGRIDLRQWSAVEISGIVLDMMVHVEMWFEVFKLRSRPHQNDPRRTIWCVASRTLISQQEQQTCRHVIDEFAGGCSVGG